MLDIGDVIEYRGVYYFVKGVDSFKSEQRYYYLVDLDTEQSYYSLLPFMEYATVYRKEDYMVLPNNYRQTALYYLE